MSATTVSTETFIETGAAASRGGPPGVRATRFGFAFSASGRCAAALRVLGQEATVERWRFDGTRYSQAPDTAVTLLDRRAQLLPHDDGGLVLLHRNRDESGEAPAHTVSYWHEGARKARSLGTLATSGGYLLAGARSYPLALAITIEGPNQSTIWGVAPDEIAPLLRLPGVVSGSSWLDEAGTLLAMNLTVPGERTSGIAVDLTRATWRKVWSVSPSSSDQLLLSSPVSGVLVLSSNATGAARIGWARSGEREVQFPERLHRQGYARHPLALDEAGERLLLSETAGVRSLLYVYSFAEDSLTELRVPRGRVQTPAVWSAKVIRLPLSAPEHPPVPASVHLGGTPTAPRARRWSLPRERVSSPGPRVRARLVRVAGAEYPIEAIAYGGREWQRAEALVVALHGGPASAARYEFDPVFAAFTDAGIAVLAPNYRGSTGYGEAHQQATLGAWGGPDLDDVNAIGAELTRVRARRGLAAPVVLGESYGGFLALLAACTSQGSWSGCVALAPFLSASNLHQTAGQAVADRIDALGGRTAIPTTEPADVLRMSAGLAVPLLLAHGSRDERVPVEQSRLLHRALLDAGRAEADGMSYLELDTDHAGLIEAPPSPLVHRLVRFVRATGRTRAGETATSVERR